MKYKMIKYGKNNKHVIYNNKGYVVFIGSDRKTIEFYMSKNKND
jgi:hypothetical protein